MTFLIILIGALVVAIPAVIMGLLDDRGHPFLAGLFFVLYFLVFLLICVKCEQGNAHKDGIDDTTTDTTTEWKFENFSVEYNYFE